MLRGILRKSHVLAENLRYALGSRKPRLIARLAAANAKHNPTPAISHLSAGRGFLLDLIWPHLLSNGLDRT